MAKLPELPIELYDSRHTTTADRNGSGRRVWLSTWEGRFDSWVPVEQKSRYTDGIDPSDCSNAESRLICVRVDRDGKGAGYTVGSITYPFSVCQITAHYSEVQGIASNQDDRLSSGRGQVLNLGPGRVWENGAPCDTPLNVLVRTSEWSFRRYLVHNEWQKRWIIAQQGKVNSMYYGGYAAETLRLDKLDIVTSYDEALGRLLDRIDYRIEFNARGWNYHWNNGQWMRVRPPIFELADFRLVVGAAMVGF